MLDDRWLLWRLKRGSARALCRLYGQYEADLLTLAASLLGRSDQAEDVLQDVFLRFIESLDTFELTGSLKGYLAACVVNRSRDLRRRERCRPAQTRTHVAAPETVSASLVGGARQRTSCLERSQVALPYVQRLGKSAVCACQNPDPRD